MTKTQAKSASTADKAPAKKAAAKSTAAESAPAKKAAPAKTAAKPASAIAKTDAPAKAAAKSKPSAGPAVEAAAVPEAPKTQNSNNVGGFADRFSPPKPAVKMYAEPLESQKPQAKADPKVANAWKTKPGSELTEAEILAMPDSEYMNDKQLDFFRAKLQALKDDLLSNAGETTEHLREDTSIVPDPADRATIEEEHALELRTRDRERKLLKKIAQSLARIDAGDYGFCDETGEPIGLGRLIARPTATLSLEAQQRREMKQKMFGD
jgi:DnaK suppressor protein